MPDVMPSTADTEELKTLRQFWYNAVYSSLDKLDKRVDNISEKINTIRTNIKSEILICKEQLMNDFKSVGENDLKLMMSLKAIGERLELLESSTVKGDLQDDIREIEREVKVAKDFLGTRREKCVKEFTQIKERLATIETKVWVFAGVIGFCSSLIATFMIFLLKTYVF